MRQRSPLAAAVTLATAGIATALLFGIFNSIAPAGPLFAREVASVTHVALRRSAPSGTRVGAPVVLPVVRVVASN